MTGTSEKDPNKKTLTVLSAGAFYFGVSGKGILSVQKRSSR